jgi:tetratricopeptide (TPR) repeat protein
VCDACRAVEAPEQAKHDRATVMGGAPVDLHSSSTFMGPAPGVHSSATVMGPGPGVHDSATVMGPPPGIHDSGTIMEPGPVPTGQRPVANTPAPERPVTATSSGPPTGDRRGATGPLVPGTTFGSRYQIVKLLGAGGMGAVYQAWDEELGVIVALKVIRPEISNDPATGPEVERQFKRELVLARQVTHRNVIRIHDLGELDGIKYITMQFVHGTNLATMLRQSGKLPLLDALRIATQVADGLAAAHDVGVVHRDLKPANIMLDDERTAYIVDFGIARSAAASATQGVVVGTLEYMSPEQAKGLPSDGRSDIYSFGLMLMDLVTGSQRFATAGSTMVELMGRMQQAPPPVRTIEPSLPEGLERVIANCLDPDPARRYQTTRELHADLLGILEGRQPTRSVPALPAAAGRSRWTQSAAAAAAVVLVIGAGAFATKGRLWGTGGATASRGASSLAVLPFRNSTGDASLDWLGESVMAMLTDGLSQSPAFRVVPSDRVSRLLSDLRIPPDDDGAPKRVSDLTSAAVVVSGKFIKSGGQALRLEAVVHDNARGSDSTLNADAADQNALADAVQRLTRDLLRSASASDRKASTAPSSRSPEAIREYTLGLQQARDARYADALKHFEAATAKDPAFALAFSKAAEMLSSLHRDIDAERMSQSAIALAPKLPEHDRYLVEARHARLNNEADKAIAAYRNALGSSPNDTSTQLELGALYETTGALDAARDELEKVTAADPKNLDALVAAGRVEIKRKNPQGAIEPLNRALAIAIQLDNEDARGTIYNAIGIAYKRLNRPDDALQNYEQSIAIKRRLNQKAGIAATLSEIGQIRGTKGQVDEALKSYQEALGIRREMGDKRGTANTLIDEGVLLTDRGKFDEALNAYREALQTERDVGDKNYEALCLNNIGNVYLARGTYSEALTYFERALEIRESLKNSADIAQTLHNVGEAAVRQGQYDKALKSYVRALDLRRAVGDKRTVALESFSIGAIAAYQGRYAAALKSQEAALGVLRELNDHGAWFAELLSVYASTLCQLGRFEEARPPLGEALTLGRQLKNGATIAQALIAQGLAAFYVGDLKGAGNAFGEASKEAVRAGAQRESLIAEIYLARIDIAEGRPQRVTTSLSAAGKKAQENGFGYEAFDASISLAEARLASGQRAQAGAELDLLVRRSEQAGLVPLAARAHAVYADFLAASDRRGDADKEYQQALALLDQIGQESGDAERLFKRADLDAIRRKARKPKAAD